MRILPAAGSIFNVPFGPFWYQFRPFAFFLFQNILDIKWNRLTTISWSKIALEAVQTSWKVLPNFANRIAPSPGQNSHFKWSKIKWASRGIEWLHPEAKIRPRSGPNAAGKFWQKPEISPIFAKRMAPSPGPNLYCEYSKITRDLWRSDRAQTAGQNSHRKWSNRT